MVAPPPPPPPTVRVLTVITVLISCFTSGPQSLKARTPITTTTTTITAIINGGDKNDVAAAPEEPPRRKIRYIPIAVLEEQKNEDAENEAAENVDDDDDDDDDDDKQIDIDPNSTESTAKVEVLDEKPDINDVPMEENQDNNQLVRQDLNERTLDLSLGLKAHDDDHDPDSKTD